MNDHKIYISHYSEDNISIDEKDRGWVDNLCRLLDMMYEQLYDSKLIFCHSKEDHGFLKTRFTHTEAVIIILSPGYLQNSECKEEMNQISGNVDPGRIFKVVKYPITDYPLNGLTNLVNYNFYRLDRETGEARTHQNLIDTNLEGTVWMKVMDLTEDLYSKLSDEPEIQKNTSTDEKKITIYLAETGNLLSVERNIIRRELSRFGFDISPKTRIPKDEEEAKNIIHKEMKDCQLSIHLIDNKQVIGKDNSHWSLAMIQNDLALEKFSGKKSKNFSRLIWIPQIEEDEGSGFESASDELEFTRNAEVLQSSLEDLKNVLKNNLVMHSEDSSQKTEQTTKNSNSLYLIYDMENEGDVQPIIEVVRKQGYEVLLPSFDNNLLEVRDKHISCLKNCDVAMIYYDSSDPIWLRMKFLDLVKSPGLGRNKGSLPKVIIHTQKQYFDQKFFAKYDTVIHELKEGDPLSFLKSLKTKSQ